MSLHDDLKSLPISLHGRTVHLDDDDVKAIQAVFEKNDWVDPATFYGYSPELKPTSKALAKSSTVYTKYKP